MRLRRLLVSSTLPFLLSSALFASGEPDAFALPGVGARAAGMGGAFIGLADDVEAVYYNPAGLGGLKDSNIQGMYQTPSLDTSRTFLAGNYHWEHERYPGSVALGWLRLSTDNIEVTDVNQTILGTTELSNDLLLIGGGIKPLDHLHVGMTLKYVRFAFDGFSESGVGVDLGAQVVYPWFRVGVAWTDVTATLLKGDSYDSSDEVTDKIPPRIRPGFALTADEPFGWPILANAVMDARFKLQGAQDMALSGGAEVWFHQESLAVRSGYQDSGGPTMGASVRWNRFQFDYAFLFSNNLQNEHRLSTTVRF